MATGICDILVMLLFVIICGRRFGIKPASHPFPLVFPYHHHPRRRLSLTYTLPLSSPLSLVAVPYLVRPSSCSSAFWSSSSSLSVSGVVAGARDFVAVSPRLCHRYALLRPLLLTLFYFAWRAIAIGLRIKGMSRLSFVAQGDNNSTLARQEARRVGCTTTCV